MKIKTIFCLMSLFVLALSGCQSGIVYDEVPESVYSNVDLGTGYAKVRVRDLFHQKVWQVNHNNGKGQWLEEYLAQTQIGDGYLNGKEYINNTGKDVTILGETLKPGDKKMVQNKLEMVDDASAPEGKRYIAHIFAPTKVTYETPNKGHLFVKKAFDGEQIQPLAFEEEVEEGMYRKVTMAVRPEALVMEFILSDLYACKVEPVDGAPVLGTPGDYTVPQKYLVTNTTFRPEGAPEYSRLYEIQVHLLEE